MNKMRELKDMGIYVQITVVVTARF